MELRIISQHFTNYPPIVWIESIGCITYSPFNWNEELGVLDIGSSLNCFIKNDSISLLNELGLSCLEEELLLDTKNSWYTWASPNNGDDKYSVKYQPEDKFKTVNGQKYQFIGNDVWARFDSSTSSYFTLTDDKEDLIFKNNANKGDTISILPYPITVKNIVYKSIQGRYLKIMITEIDTFIKNIGSLNRLLWIQNYATIPENISGNICFTKNNSIYYHYKDYYLFNDCVPKSSIHDSEVEKIKIFSFNKIIYVQGVNSLLSPKTIRIYDLTGKEIYSKKYNTKDLKIPFHHHQNIYLIEITDDQKRTIKKISID